MKTYTAAEVKGQMVKLGIPVPADLHLVGIRNKNHQTNVFDDQLMLINKDLVITGVGTTVPGTHWLKNLMNPKGTAVLKPGQYVNCWRIGLHNGYEALVQCAPITVYRDKNLDDKVDQIAGTEDKGLFQIDIHHAATGVKAWFIDKFSAGCQVWQDYQIYLKMLQACKDSSQKYFTYTLLNEF